MFYKEWLLARQKFMLIAGFYGLCVLALATIFTPNYNDQNPQPPFMTWLLVGQGLTIGAAILGGSDTFADETDKGTIGFLLTHPVSRTRVYLTKLVLNCATFAVTLLASSLVMLFVDQIPRNHAVNIGTYNDCGVWNTEYTTEISNPVTSLPDAFIGVIMMLLLGVTLLCLSTLISVYAHTTVSTLMYTIFAFLVLAIGIIFLNGRLSQNALDIGSLRNFQLLPYILPLIVVFFCLGLFSFRRREF